MRDLESRWWAPWHEVDATTVFHVDLSPDAEREALACELLDDEEKVRSRRFVVERPRCRFVLCRAALRVLLSERLGCSHREISFGYLEHGKPFAKAKGRRAPVGFNVSHSGRHGLIAVAEHDWLGVDVEERTPERDLDAIGRKVYGPRERQVLTEAAGGRKAHVFFRLWSMKEALIKALGTGFSLHPSRFEVPGPMLRGTRSGDFRFPHSPANAWRLQDLGEARFAAALAWRSPPCPVERSTPAD